MGGLKQAVSVAGVVVVTDHAKARGTQGVSPSSRRIWTYHALSSRRIWTYHALSSIGWPDEKDVAAPSGLTEAGSTTLKQISLTQGPPGHSDFQESLGAPHMTPYMVSTGP
jgi:hypothetical protein